MVNEEGDSPLSHSIGCHSNSSTCDRQQGDAILNLFYPDHERFWLGLLPGVPAVLAFLLSGYRQRLPRLWRAVGGVLGLSPGHSNSSTCDSTSSQRIARHRRGRR